MWQKQTRHQVTPKVAMLYRDCCLWFLCFFEVWTLRRLRDHTLAESWYGHAFICTYYAINFTLVK